MIFPLHHCVCRYPSGLVLCKTKTIPIPARHSLTYPPTYLPPPPPHTHTVGGSRSDVRAGRTFRAVAPNITVSIIIIIVIVATVGESYRWH